MIENSETMFMRTRLYILLVIPLGVLLGCAPWDQTKKTGSISFPKARMAVDAVGLEIAVAQLDLGQSESFESFWSLLDQQELSLDLRKRLDQNGIRAAIMASHPPPMFQQLVDPKTLAPEEMNALEVQLNEHGLLRPTPRMVTHDRISNREGESHIVATSEYHPQASWTVLAGSSQTPGVAEHARGVMAISTYPQGDGSVRLIIRPEIHHGLSRQRIGVGGGTFLIESGQSVLPINDLKIEVNLRSGESLVLAPTRDISDLGRIFFGRPELDSQPESKKSPLTHRFLVIRVIQTQMDDLFSDSNIGEKLTNSPGL